MADRPGDDAAKQHAPANAASALDQSLSASTATTTAESCRTSSFNNRVEESDAGAEPTHADAIASELHDLRLELALARRELLEQERVHHDVDIADAIDRQVADEIGDAEHQVREFSGGIFRGQVRLHKSLSETTEWVPHGLGVLVTTTGHTLCGQWLDGKQVGHGTHYTPTLHYEGDFGSSSDPTGAPRYGVGLYTFGALFTGCWHHQRTAAGRAQFYPHGLGSWQHAVDPSVEGWFTGLRCIHECSSEMDASDSIVCILSPSLRMESQPKRGLLVADQNLQFWRRRALTRALSAWSRLCCDFATAKARRSRLLALETQQQARQAEQRAIQEDLERKKELKRDEAGELLTRLTSAREAQDRRNHRRQLHAQRLDRAIGQRDLARECLAKQQAATATLENALREVVEQLEEARQAQTLCGQYAHELDVLKRQIENTSVKLNEVRFSVHRSNKSLVNKEEGSAAGSIGSESSPPPTPVVKTPRRRDSSFRSDDLIDSSQTAHHSVEQFVCGVPGCKCGIPRDVFLRVAGVLNDE